MKINTAHNEKELLVRVANNDQEAFSELVNLYSNKVFSHALTYIKSYPEAEELVQDIFLKVWKNRAHLTTITEFKNYLFILGKNQLISSLRKRSMETVDDDFKQIPELSLVPDKQYQSKEIYQKLLEGVAQLPPQQKSVFTLSRMENLTHEEIALRLGITKRTVKFHLVLALNFLRSFLHESDYYLPLALLLASSHFV